MYTVDHSFGYRSKNSHFNLVYTVMTECIFVMSIMFNLHLLNALYLCQLGILCIYKMCDCRINQVHSVFTECIIAMSLIYIILFIIVTCKYKFIITVIKISMFAQPHRTYK